MRTSNINVRVEPEVSRGLTWATNKYNYENNAALTKTDVIELLVKAILTEPNFLKFADALVNKTDWGYQAAYEEWLEAIENGSATALVRAEVKATAGDKMQRVTSNMKEALKEAGLEHSIRAIRDVLIDELGPQHIIEVRHSEPIKQFQGFHILIDGSRQYAIEDRRYKEDKLEAVMEIVKLYKEDIAREDS